MITHRTAGHILGAALVLCVLGAAALAVILVVQEKQDARQRGQTPISSPFGVTSVCLPDQSGQRLYSGPDGRPFAILETSWRATSDPYYCPED